MKEFWEKRYAAEEYAYGKAPNTFLRTELEHLEPGHALFPAEGEGRNAVYAAQLGWSVEAFDYSNAARQKALRLAKDSQVNLQYQVASIESFPFERKEYDLIALFFVHLPPTLRQQLHTACASALRPGGTLLLEAFHKEQLPLQSGGPKQETLLFSLEDLEADFAALSLGQISRQRVILEEGPYHHGPAETVRIRATKHQ
ncbi:class I SAM-dependent methyltransferase [Phaeodactylibacter xiamenensis]|uniref:class I SAM-dependent methyltransferase n=1 Tax=Phaeodactylibacter xiamenensis TaxID=1524460 RepID=UPI0024A8271B|nr:class I SAM-dependent methyltransferase [Phaeodactylibacter xiamenensis]